MGTISNFSLTDFGLDDWLTQQANEHCADEHTLARVVIVDRDRYTVYSESGEHIAQLTGHLHHQLHSHSEFPCVGDWVCLLPDEAESPRRIQTVVPRKTFLRRKTAGKDVDFQMIAANIDVAFIVQSCHFDFNLRRLERYLVMVNEGHIEPIIVLTKTDLLPESDVTQLIENIRHAGIGNDIITLSNITGEGLDNIVQRITPGRTYCLIGSSGVGKTSLINRLRDNATLPTNTVSGTGEGRHTTVRRQLILLENKAMLVDTPGMRELGVLADSDGITSSFDQVDALSRQCRFSDCTHGNEPGCAIRQAIADGRIDEAHFNSFQKLQKESQHNAMSYSEKRKSDKAFGRYVRSVMKDVKKRKKDY